MTCKVIFAILPITALTACMNMNEPIAPSYGKAVEANMRAQIIDPNPSAGTLTMSGTRAALSVERYNKGEVIRPERIETSDTGSR